MELIARGLTALRETCFSVPNQQLGVPTDRFPTLPRSGLILDLA